MTDLDKPVRRRTRAPFGNHRRRLVITLEPGDTLAMRLERSRTVYRAPLATVFRQLAGWHAQAATRRKREERKRKNAA